MAITKVYLIGSVFLFAAPRLASAEGDGPPSTQAPERPRSNAVQLDLGLAVIGLAYERVLADTVALQLEGQVFGTWFGPYFDKPNFTGFGGQIRSSFFPFGHAPRGLYIAPFVRVDRVTGEAQGKKGSGVGASYGGFVGYSFVFWDRWNARVGGGAQYMSYAVNAGGERLEMRTFFPGLDLVVGCGF
jgi:hypothetical protein